jgi:hypothetical protein
LFRGLSAAARVEYVLVVLVDVVAMADKRREGGPLSFVHPLHITTVPLITSRSSQLCAMAPQDAEGQPPPQQRS